VAASGRSQHPKEIGACTLLDRFQMTVPTLMMPAPLRDTGPTSLTCINGFADLNRSLSPCSSKSDSSEYDGGSATPPPSQWRFTPPSRQSRITSQSNTSCCSTPPLMVQSHTIRKPVLMKALYTNDVTKSVAQILGILELDPEIINEPFWDHDCEPPLCCAVRLQRPAAIVRLLLEHGACTEDTDSHGRTPAQIALESPEKPWMHGVPPFDVGAPPSWMHSVAPFDVPSPPSWMHSVAPFGVVAPPHLLDVGPKMGFFGAPSTYQYVRKEKDVHSPFDTWRAEIAELFEGHITNLLQPSKVIA